jgi:hypothetical protein
VISDSLSEGESGWLKLEQKLSGETSSTRPNFDNVVQAGSDDGFRESDSEDR